MSSPMKIQSIRLAVMLAVVGSLASCGGAATDAAAPATETTAAPSAAEAAAVTSTIPGSTK